MDVSQNRGETPQNGWFIMVPNPIKMKDLGVFSHIFGSTPKCCLKIDSFSSSHFITAWAGEVRKAYRQLALKYHPDKGKEHRSAVLFVKIKLWKPRNHDILPETNSSPLKMDGWNSTFLLGRPIFRAMLVSGRVKMLVYSKGGDFI